MKNFIFKKNIPGGLIFDLESYDFSLPKRTFDMPYNVGQLSIPEQYALGLFVTSSALDMFQAGLFTIEDFEDLKKKAEEIGLAGDIPFVKIYTAKELKEIVESGDTAKIDQILNRKNPNEMTSLIAVVRDDLNRPDSAISSGIVRKIENACGVELTIE